MSLQKLAWLLVAVVLLAVPWLWWGSPWLGDATAPAPGEAAALATGRVDAAHAPVAAPTGASEGSPTSVTREAAAAATTGALVVQVRYADGGPVADAVVDVHRSGTERFLPVKFALREEGGSWVIEVAPSIRGAWGWTRARCAAPSGRAQGGRAPTETTVERGVALHTFRL